MDPQRRGQGQASQWFSLRGAVVALAVLAFFSADIFRAFQPERKAQPAAKENGLDNTPKRNGFPFMATADAFSVEGNSDSSSTKDRLEGFEDEVPNNDEGEEAELDAGGASETNAAVQVRQLLQAEFPGVEVSLENYPVPAPREMLSQALSVAQMAFIAVAIGGDQLLPMMGIEPPFPQWYQGVRQNRIGAAAGVWILGNTLNNMLISTGAFEVYVDGSIAFSKLQSNRMPTLPELLSAVRLAME